MTHQFFSQSDICKGIENGVFQIPASSLNNGYMLLYVFTEADIFPLKSWLMEPFPGKGLTEKRLSTTTGNQDVDVP
mgnify:FL=1